jgi:hypothetical protein
MLQVIDPSGMERAQRSTQAQLDLYGPASGQRPARTRSSGEAAPRQRHLATTLHSDVDVAPADARRAGQIVTDDRICARRDVGSAWRGQWRATELAQHLLHLHDLVALRLRHLLRQVADIRLGGVLSGVLRHGQAPLMVMDHEL